MSPSIVFTVHLAWCRQYGSDSWSSRWYLELWYHHSFSMLCTRGVFIYMNTPPAYRVVSLYDWLKISASCASSCSPWYRLWM